MELAACLLRWLLATATVASAEVTSCKHHDTLFDIGLAKVLNSTQFSALAVDEIWETFGGFYKAHVWLHSGALYGLRNLRRAVRNHISAEDNGVHVVLQVEGGPVHVTYQGRVRSALQSPRIMVDVYISHLDIALYAMEPFPARLQLKIFSSRNSRARVSVDTLGSSSLIFDIGRRLSQKSLEREVSNTVGPVLLNMSNQFLGMVELYAKNGTKIGDVMKPRLEPEFESSFLVNIIESRFRHQDLGPEIFEPVVWENTSALGIFHLCARRVILGAGLDPLIIADVPDATFGEQVLQISNVSVEGLANVRRGGDNFDKIEQCGLVALVALTFEKVKVQINGTKFWMPITVDVDIEAFEVLLNVTENNKTLSIDSYVLNFPVPVKWEAKVLTPLIGWEI
ncbi:uncharacterized protein LOC144167290 [Haemaphysalis longicornis]